MAISAKPTGLRPYRLSVASPRGSRCPVALPFSGCLPCAVLEERRMWSARP
jgi:hypothetical protein